MNLRLIFQPILNGVMLFTLRSMYKFWRKTNRHSNARLWSNDELKKLTPFLTGDIINVSAGRDGNKDGGTYKSFFTNASSYTITNYNKEFPDDAEYREIALDLNKPIEASSVLFAKYDVVFTHTVLEHVYQINTAIENLCKISKDIIITIIPYIQSYHQEEPIYHDYWRISPYALINLFNESAFQTIYMNWNNDPLGNIYIFHVASRNPEKWASIKSLQHHNQYGPGYDRQLLLSNTGECTNGTLNPIDFTKQYS
jgi:hypothetical protein